MNYALAVPLLIAAAVLGNQTNYTIGSLIGPRVFDWEHSRLFNKRAFERAHAFYEEYGGITLIAARFLPFLRTFAPFVAGVAQMTRPKFTLYDVTGGSLWVVSIVTAGYLFGNLEWVQTHMSKIIWAMIILPGMLALLGAWRAKRAKPESA
jgi:membrane-associated protein